MLKRAKKIYWIKRFILVSGGNMPGEQGKPRSRLLPYLEIIVISII
jgi:hypothetical protein